MQYRLAGILRTRLYHAVSGKAKGGSAIKDLGCSMHELIMYLESKFEDGMTWDNYGKGGWHIDHILPLSSFDLIDNAQLQSACHYTNLQPMWELENLMKGAKIL